MNLRVTLWLTLAIGWAGGGLCNAEETLFEDAFNGSLSDKWLPVDMKQQDYRIRDGALELRIQPQRSGGITPMLKVDLPFKTSDTVRASVEVSIVGGPLKRGEFAGLCLTDPDGQSFSCRITNIDGYSLFSPGLVEFIGKPGEEGDPGKYTVKYWPAASDAGPLNIIVRHHYAHFQVGPSRDGKYLTFFHSAIAEESRGLGFGLMAGGGSVAPDADERWARFDNFRVRK